jgi:hypothetical protein
LVLKTYDGTKLRFCEARRMDVAPMATVATGSREGTGNPEFPQRTDLPPNVSNCE